MAKMECDINKALGDYRNGTEMGVEHVPVSVAKEILDWFSVLIHLAKDQVLAAFLGGLAVDAHSTSCD